MLFSFQNYINKRKIRENLIKFIDTTFTVIGLILIITAIIMTIPFLILDRWLSGER